MESVVLAQIAALEPMREPRSLVLGTLAVTCAFAFVAAARMLRPAGLPREGMRRLLPEALPSSRRCCASSTGPSGQVVVNRANAATVEAMILPLKGLQSPVADFMRQLIPHIPPALPWPTPSSSSRAFVVLGRTSTATACREAVIAQDGPTE